MIVYASGKISEPVSKEVFIFPASFAQQRLWFLDQLERETAVYNMTSAMRIAGAVETRALKQSINEIVQRHEALRTTFKPVDGQPMQLVSESASLNLPVIDLPELPAELREAESKQLAISEAQQS